MKRVVIEIEKGIAFVAEADPDIEVVVRDIDGDSNPYCSINIYRGTELVRHEEKTWEEVRGKDTRPPTDPSERQAGYKVFNKTEGIFATPAPLPTMKSAREFCAQFRQSHETQARHGKAPKGRTRAKDVLLAIHTPRGEEVEA